MAGGRRVPKRPWWVYVLRCADGSFYTGITPDVGKRLRRHRSGDGSKYVASRLPAKLVLAFRAGPVGRALRLEAAIKRLPRSGKKALVLGLVKLTGLRPIRKPRPSAG